MRVSANGRGEGLAEDGSNPSATDRGSPKMAARPCHEAGAGHALAQATLPNEGPLKVPDLLVEDKGAGHGGQLAEGTEMTEGTQGGSPRELGRTASVICVPYVPVVPGMAICGRDGPQNQRELNAALAGVQL